MANTSSKALGGMLLELDFGAGLPRAKRRKIGQACENCRLKKVKCDGTRPICGPCASRKATKDTCKWQDRALEQEPSRQASESEQPVVTNESERESPVQTEHLDSMNAEQGQQAPYLGNKINHTLQPMHSTSPSSYSIPPSSHARQMSPVESEQSEEKDAMGNFDSEGLRTGVLGTSSSQSFMKSMMELAEGNRLFQPNGVYDTSVKALHPSTIRRKWNSRSVLQVADYLLPPRKTADRLLKIHWDKSQIIFPWLDQLEFSNWYESLWTGREAESQGNESVSHCILNIIFAISYKLESTTLPEEQENLAHSHFTRAEKLLSMNLLDLCHFELVQALLLMAQYLQSTSMPRQCFQSVSLAIWIAQNLDLHRPEAIASIPNPRERELACRVWQGCILYDRVMSMTMGKTLLISQAAARKATLPASMETEYLDGIWTVSPPANQPIYSEFFTAYCQLHILLGDILQTFYSTDVQAHDQLESSGTTSSGKQHIDELLGFDDAITSWRSRLPEHLKMSCGDSQSASSRRQAGSLALRALHIRMLLFRPFFSYSRTAHGDNVEFSNEHRFADGIRKDGLLACTTSAQLIIDMIASQSNDGGPNFLPPYWHVIAYTHTAATVIIAAHLHSIVVQQLSASALSISLRQAFDILQRYEKDRSSARKCKAALSALCDRIMTFRSRAHSPVGTDDLQTATALNDMVQSLGPTEPFLEADFWNLEDDTDMLWLNSAPFDSNNNFWL